MRKTHHLYKHFKYCCISKWVKEASVPEPLSLHFLESYAMSLKCEAGFLLPPAFRRPVELLRACEPHCQILSPTLKRSIFGECVTGSLKWDRHLKKKGFLIGFFACHLSSSSEVLGLDLTGNEHCPWVILGMKFCMTSGSKGINLIQVISQKLNYVLLIERKVCWGTSPQWQS